VLRSSTSVSEDYRRLPCETFTPVTLLIDGQEATRIGPVNDLFFARHVGLVAQFTWLEIGSYKVTKL